MPPESVNSDVITTGLFKSHLLSRFGMRFFSWSIGFILVPMGILVGVSLSLVNSAVRDEALQNLSMDAGNGRHRIEQFIRQVKEITQRATTGPLVQAALEATIQSPAADTGALRNHCLDELSAVLGPGSRTTILDRSGQIIMSTETRVVGSNCSTAEYFLKGKTTTRVTDVFRDTLESRRSWIISAPIVGPNGAFLGEIVNRLDPGQLTSLLAGRMLQPDDATVDPQHESGKRAYLVNRAGFLRTEAPFFSTALVNQAVDTKPVRYARDTGKSMAGDYTDIRRVRVAGASELIPEMGWVVIAEEDYDLAMAPYVRLRNSILLLSVAVFALALVMVIRMGTGVVRPLCTLIHAEERLVTGGGAGALVPEDRIPDDEMGELIHRRNEIIQQVVAAERRRQELVDEIDGIAWEAEVGTWCFTFVSRRAEQILGYPAEQWLTEPGFWVKHLHPVDRSRTVQAYLEASITGKSLQFEYRMVASDGRAVWLRDQAHHVDSPTPSDGNPVRKLRGLMIDITAAKQAQDLLQESERRSRMIIEMSRDAIIGIDSKGSISVFNHAAEQIFRIPAREIIGSSMQRLLPEDLRDSHAKAITRFLTMNRTGGLASEPKETRGLRNDASEFPMEIWLRPTNDASLRVLVTIQDITSRKKAEEDRAQHYRQLDALHELTNALIRAETVEGIYLEAMSCAKLALQADGVSVILADPDGRMRTKASGGVSDQYRAATEGRLLWSEDPANLRPLIVPDVESIVEQGPTQPTILSRTDLEELRPVMLAEGIRALAAIPLEYRGRLLGRLMVYFNTKHEFTGTEVHFAQTIAAHVAFAIGRQRADNVLRAVVDGTSLSTGMEFFRALVRHLANTLRVRWAFVGESIGVGRDKIRTLALWSGSDYAPNFEYDLAGTPCAGLVGEAMCCYPKGIARLFPHDLLLTDLRVESYVGVRLSDASGNSLGILAVMDDEPIPEPSQVEAVLSAFAARAGAEVERSQAEQRLAQEHTRYDSIPEQIGEPFFICDAATGRLIEASPAFQTFLGYTRDELLSLTIRELGCDNLAELEYLLTGDKRGSHHTLPPMRFRRKDGAPAVATGSASLIVSDYQRALFVLLRPMRREAAQPIHDSPTHLECPPVGAARG